MKEISTDLNVGYRHLLFHVNSVTLGKNKEVNECSIDLVTSFNPFFKVSGGLYERSVDCYTYTAPSVVKAFVEQFLDEDFLDGLDQIVKEVL